MQEPMKEPRLWGTPRYADAAIEYVWRHIAIAYWNIHQRTFDATYGVVEGDLGLPGVVVRPYSWSGADDANWKPNLEINGVGIWWYKYFGRAMEANVNWTPSQWAEWLEGSMNLIIRVEREMLDKWWPSQQGDTQ